MDKDIKLPHAAIKRKKAFCIESPFKYKIVFSYFHDILNLSGIFTVFFLSEETFCPV